ncbi:MAG: hypothetical protein KKE24_03340 [Candidatus Thermoplasmatota archaeon]|nr:hypothetical protein [Candidatus Thermoplasmatota archaeon]
MPSYPNKTIKKELGSFKRKGDMPSGIKQYTLHKILPSIRAEKSNDKNERLHGTEKSRTKIMRAFDHEAGASALMDGWRVHYDMIRTHQTLVMTPAEAADIPSLPGFKWYELIKLASRQSS